MVEGRKGRLRACGVTDLGYRLTSSMQWNAYDEPATLRIIGFNPDLSAVSFYDMLHDGQTESRSAQFT